MIFANFAVLVMMARQHQAEVASWTPPKTTLPREFVSSIRFMLNHGFADPRAGHLAQARIRLHNLWQVEEPTPVFGWLMPREIGKPQIIVTPNGLSYPVESVTKESVTAKDAFPLHPERERPPTPALANGYGKSACLLLTGNVALAEKVYVGIPEEDRQRPFIGLASNYLAGRYLRAVQAHMSGDDESAFADSLSLQRDRAPFQAEAIRVVGRKELEDQIPENQRRMGWGIAFRFLAPINELVTDSERRVKLRHRKPIELPLNKSIPQADRIATLIDHLQDTKVLQHSQPGGVNLKEDPIISALAAEGTVAIPAILDTIEHDKRLTRSVSFWRDYVPDRSLLSVQGAAYTAFCLIVGVEEERGTDNPVDITKLRAYWAHTSSLPLADRWMKTLGDDKARPDQWIDSALRILAPEGQDRLAFQRNGQTKINGKPIVRRGESLRNRRTPSVSDLFDKRAAQLTKSLDFMNGTLEALEMAQFHFLWDSKTSLPVIQLITRRVLTSQTSSIEVDSRTLAYLLEERWQLGDKSVIPEFTGWLGRISKTDDCQSGLARSLSLLVNIKGNTSLQAAAASLFEGPNSSWNLKKHAPKLIKYGNFPDIVASPLLGLPPVQRSVRSLLLNRTVRGKTWIKNGVLMRSVIDMPGDQKVGNSDSADPLFPKIGETRSIRICDSLASDLDRLRGAPKFHEYWPDAVKNKAIDQLIALIDQNKGNIAKILEWPESWEEDPPNTIYN